MTGTARLRRVLAIALLALLGAITWLRQPLPPSSTDQRIVLGPLALPRTKAVAPLLGPFRIEAAWQMKSRHGLFGGYSGLVLLNDGQLMAISDRGAGLRFRPPGPSPHIQRQTGWFQEIQFNSKPSRDRDAEAAAHDPATDRIWIATEVSNGISRHDAGLQREARVWPKAMDAWNDARGPESMVRLADGRFIVIAEGTAGWFERRRHEALLFPRDPTWKAPAEGDAPQRFTFETAPGYWPTDMAALPDGRVLILLRRVALPFGFEGRLAIADPAEIEAGGVWKARTLATLVRPLPTDNYEAMTVAPGENGKLTVWIMSDDNGALFQRTLLLKLSLDPAGLPKRRKARESLRALSAIQPVRD